MATDSHSAVNGLTIKWPQHRYTHLLTCPPLLLRSRSAQETERGSSLHSVQVAVSLHTGVSHQVSTVLSDRCTRALRTTVLYPARPLPVLIHVPPRIQLRFDFTRVELARTQAHYERRAPEPACPSAAPPPDAPCPVRRTPPPRSPPPAASRSRAPALAYAGRPPPPSPRPTVAAAYPHLDARAPPPAPRCKYPMAHPPKVYPPGRSPSITSTQSGERCTKVIALGRVFVDQPQRAYRDMPRRQSDHAFQHSTAVFQRTSAHPLSRSLALSLSHTLRGHLSTTYLSTAVACTAAALFARAAAAAAAAAAVAASWSARSCAKFQAISPRAQGAQPFPDHVACPPLAKLIERLCRGPKSCRCVMGYQRPGRTRVHTHHPEPVA